MMLTDTKIKNLKPRDKKYKISDAENLFLVVQPTGGKHWRYGYRFAGKQRELSIGRYPDISLAKARDKKREAQDLLREFRDPSLQKQEERLLAVYKDRNRFSEIAEEWFEQNKTSWSEKHSKKLWGRLENHVLPYLGKRPISEIKPIEVLGVIQRIEKAGSTFTSGRVLGICRAIFGFAIYTSRLDSNPAEYLNKALVKHKEKHYPKIESWELPEFFESFRALDTARQNKIAMLFLLHTGVRTGEMRYAEWNEFDFKGAIWRIPKERMKQGVEHWVPLSSQVLEMLSELREITGNSRWLFPNSTRRENPVISENVINHLLRRMGYKGRLVGHGFRSMFSTILNEEGKFNRDAIERQLAHAEKNSVRAAYNRAQYLDERREMMQWWSGYLEEKSSSATHR